MAHESSAHILSVSFVFVFLTALGSAQAAITELESPSERQHGSFGISVSGVPDVNGDSRGDVLVGEGGEDIGSGLQGAGRAHIFDGSNDALLQTLASPNGEFGGRFGISVSGVSDVNGDGRGDVVIGAPYESPGDSPHRAGRAYIFDGATGALLQTLASPNEEEDGVFGESVSGVPDVNGDGRGDVVIGARGEGPGTSPDEAGRAYIFDGSTGAPLRTLASPNERKRGRFGFSVSGSPDVNGDGLGDAIVGAYLEDPSDRSFAGRAYLFDGSTGLHLRTLVSPNVEVGGIFGFSVSGVSDLSGDGRGDVVVGTDEHLGDLDNAGRVHIFDGATGTFLRTLASPNAENGGNFGESVSGVPDVNGDGRGDVVIGADEGLGAIGRAGRAYVFDGATGTLLRTLTSPNAEILGHFGFSVSGVPDVNGDGRGDVVIGARSEDPGVSPVDAGRVYIFDSEPGPVPSLIRNWGLYE